MSAELSSVVATLLTTNMNFNLQLIWLTEDILHRLDQICLFSKSHNKVISNFSIFLKRLQQYNT